MVRIIYRLLSLLRSIKHSISPNTDTSLEKIEQAHYPIVIVPWHGEPIPVLLRRLTQAQIIACGDFSVIETFQDQIEKKRLEKHPKLEGIAEYAHRHHEIVKRSLVKPTYAEIMELITDDGISEIKKESDVLKELLKETPRGPRRTELEEQLAAIDIWTDLLLPEDFSGAIVSYALQIDESDIKELTEETLLQAAILAEKGHNNPADHIDGMFTPFMKDDINCRAWMILEEKRKEKKESRRGAAG